MHGHIDNDDSGAGFPNLERTLNSFFAERTYGILTALKTSISLFCRNRPDSVSYCLLDSHKRGPKGYKAPFRGESCCMHFGDINGLHNILRRNLYSRSGEELRLNIFSLTPISVIPKCEIVTQNENRNSSQRKVSSLLLQILLSIMLLR